MARGVDDYRDLLLMLLPVGDAWSREVDSDIAKLFKGVAEEFVRIDGHAELLLKESVPSGVTALIEEYEKDWDLPGKCIAPGTVNERRNVLVNKVVGIRDQSRQTYIDRAARLGVPITITEYAPGDSVPGHAEIPTPDACYVIQINAALTNHVQRTYAGAYGEPYSTFGNAQMECALREILQAHRILIFTYN